MFSDDDSDIEEANAKRLEKAKKNPLKGSFVVDETFVKEHLTGLTEEDKSLMDSFVAQSLEGRRAESSSKEVRVRRALFRIGDVPERLCDDSPVAGVINAKGRTANEFDYKGKLIATEGKKPTKLTKLFKRRDNEGLLLDALKRMQLDE